MLPALPRLAHSFIMQGKVANDHVTKARVHVGATSY